MTVHTLEQIAQHLNAKLVLKPGARGDEKISSVSTLTEAQSGQIAFLSDAKYIKDLPMTRASAVMLTQEFADTCPVSALILANPYLGFAKVGALFQKQLHDVQGIHPSAIVDASAEIDSSASIGPLVTIGPHVKIAAGVVIRAGCSIMDGASIGQETVLYPRVTLYPNVKLGARCIIHSGAVIGSDGFGLANDKGQWVKIPQLGTAVLGDDVEIGANTTIDRGALRDTQIGCGVKIDNQVQVAHNVIIGDHTAIAAQAGIAGSTEIGRYCLVGGGSGINGHIKIGHQVHLAGHSVVTRSLDKPGIYVSVLPVAEQRSWHKSAARFYQLDALTRRLKQCEKALGLGKVDNNQEES